MPVTKRRLRDLSLEILIAVAIVACALLWANSVPPHAAFPTKWVGLIVFTAVAFGDTLQSCKRHWRLARFWLAFTTLLLLHSVIFALVLLRAEHWRLIWFVPVGAVEFPLLHYVLHAVGNGTVKGLRGKSGTESGSE